MPMASVATSMGSFGKRELAILALYHVMHGCDCVICLSAPRAKDATNGRREAHTAAARQAEARILDTLRLLFKC